MNKKLILTLNKWGGVIENGTWIDCYNRIINKSISGTITTRISEGNYWFVAVDKKNHGGGFLKIRNATQKGYLIAEEGDGIDIGSRMQWHRGTVQKGISQTLTRKIEVGVIVKDER